MKRFALIIAALLSLWPATLHAFIFTGGLVFDSRNTRNKNAMLSDFTNLNNVIGAAQVLVAQQKVQVQEEINRAFGDRMEWEISLPDSPLMETDYVRAREEIVRILSTLAADHPARPGLEAQLRNIESLERLTVFRAKLAQSSAASKSPLSLMDRMRLQDELNMIKGEVLIEATSQSAQANRELLMLRQKKLDARRALKERQDAINQFQ